MHKYDINENENLEQLEKERNAKMFISTIDKEERKQRNEYALSRLDYHLAYTAGVQD